MAHIPRTVNLNVDVAITQAEHQMLWQRCRHWASAQPDKIAMVTPQGAWTYGQLNQAIDRVAAAVGRVRDTINGQPLRVLLLFKDALSHLAAITGVEKAGACHVSLHPASPIAFLQQIAADVEPGLILTESALAERAAELAPADLPRLVFSALPEADEPTERACTLDDLHSILYTSGSSGRPKGVMRSRYFEAFNVARDLGSGLNRHSERALCTASLSTGLGYRYVRNVLVVGGTVYLSDLSGDWVSIARKWLQEEGITFLGTIPSLQRLLLEGGATEQVYPAIEILSTGGEAVLPSDFESFRRHCVHGALFNVIYGASEGGIYSMEFLTHDSTFAADGLPLGKPLGFVEILIVDEQMNHLPSGQIGEIAIRSPTTAEGYWKMPELTARKFLPDPDGGRRRIYRSGDLGRLLQDGTVQFLGRLDDEVKVNGNRISLPLIENALRAFPGIENVTVQPQTRQDGGTYLAGYYVALKQREIAPQQLRAHLEPRLPGYMIPAHFVRIERIPLNSAGKVDRFALPRADDGVRVAAETLVAPRDELEQRIARIWSNILGIEQIGVNDRFSDLGGDSLQAVNMLLQVNWDLKTVLDIPALNQVRTVAELAGVIRSNADTKRYPPYGLLKEGRGTPFFLFHAVGGNILVYQPLAARLRGEMPVYGILAQGMNADEPPLVDVAAIAQHHIHLMKSVQPAGPYYFGGYSFGGIVAYEAAQQLTAAGEQVGLVLVLDSRVRLAKSATPAQRLVARLGREGRRIAHHARYFATHAPTAWPAYATELVTRAKRARRNAALLGRLEAGFDEQVDRYLDEVERVASPTILAVIDAHHVAIARYCPKPYAGDVTVVLAQETNFEGIEAWKSPWREAVQGRVTFIDVPGNHRSMMYEPNVQILAEKMNAILAQALPQQSIGTKIPG